MDRLYCIIIKDKGHGKSRVDRLYRIIIKDKGHGKSLRAQYHLVVIAYRANRESLQKLRKVTSGYELLEGNDKQQHTFG